MEESTLEFEETCLAGEESSDEELARLEATKLNWYRDQHSSIITEVNDTLPLWTQKKSSLIRYPLIVAK